MPKFILLSLAHMCLVDVILHQFLPDQIKKYPSCQYPIHLGYLYYIDQTIQNPPHHYLHFTYLSCVVAAES